MYRSMDIHDHVTSLVDTINREPDPAVRLAYLSDALSYSREALVAARNEAAYEARQHYATADLEQILGLNAAVVNGWLRAHALRHGLPLPRQQRRADLANAHDLTRLPKDRQESLNRHLGTGSA